MVEAAGPVAQGLPPPRPGWAEALRRGWPGAALCGVIALSATFVSQSYGGPQLLYALLLGMALQSFGAEPRAAAGIEFCTRVLMRVGVVLLGARITLAQMAALGWGTAALVAAAVASTIALGLLLARGLGLPRMQGLLSGGATAICGASAALAISAALPRRPETDRFTLLVVVCVSTLSTLAMLAYPLLARALALPPELAGLFLGATIHDVAQVVGAGYLLGPQVGDTAVIVKLFRVGLLAVVVMAVGAAVATRRRHVGGGRARLAPGQVLPWFLQGYLLLVIVNSAGWVPSGLQPVLSDASRACLVMAIAALGLRTALSTLAETGWRPLLLLLVETLWIAAFVLAVILLTG